jgi:hypothetical protein
MRRLSSLRRRRLAAPAALACVAVMACVASTATATSASPQAAARAVPASVNGATPAKPVIAATLEECLTAGSASNRSATFGGEMSAIAGATRMQMRIEVLERMPREALFHTVIAPGLGVWRNAAAGVKIYKYLKQVTNLAAPASYRGAVRFRWLTAKGRIVKVAELRTPKCDEPSPPPSEGSSSEQPSQSGAGAPSTASSGG